MNNNSTTKKRIILMYLLSFLAMFATAYAAIYIWDHFYININKVYMAALMVASMGIINSLVMQHMYSKRGSLYVLAGSILLFVGSFWAIRAQGAVGNEQFLKSMIPHHSSAILMCNRSAVTDERIEDLCTEIVKTQREEINIMQDILRDY